ncbi:MAG: glycosyltransferase family 39 protein [Chloroflexi bacterium]|nr:glycosyltransferase family 39 protein [Chloroflexota bacterium]
MGQAGEQVLTSRGERDEGWSARRIPLMVWVGGAVAVGFASRAYALDRQSLWYDEAVSLLYARLAPAELLELAAADNHPPLSYLLLAGWLPAAGETDFAARFLSVLAGIPAIPLVFRLGRQVLPACFRHWAPVAAWLLAASPWHVWYSQEARMYSLATTLALATGVLFLAAWEGRTLHRWGRYSVAGAALLYTHYYGGLVLLGQTAFAVGRWLAGGSPLLRRCLAGWLAGQTAIAVIFLPWVGALVARAAEDATAWPGSIDWRLFMGQIATALAVGRTLPAEDALAPTLAALALVAVGAVALLAWSGDSRSRSAFLLAGVVVPPIALFGLVSGRPKFDPRYLLAVLPLVDLLAATGLAALALGALLSRRHASCVIRYPSCGAAVLLLALGALLLGVWQAGALRSLAALYGDPAAAREDFRGAMRFIEAQARADDAVVVVSGHAAVPLLHYRTRPIDVFPLPERIVTDLRRPLRADEVVGRLNDIAAGHRRVWLVRWQVELADPSDGVLHQLWLHGREQTVSRRFHGLDVRLFDLPSGIRFVAEPQPQRLRQDRFGDLIELRGVDADRTVVRAGGTIAVTLYWRASAPASGDPVAFLHLLNGAQRVYAQIDRRPGGDFNPPSRWPAGEIVRDPYYLTVPAGTPPGRYSVEAGLYWPATMVRLLLPDGADRAELLVVDVERDPDAPGEPAIQRPLAADFGPVRLLGYELERGEYVPGEEIRVRFWWRAQQRPQDDLRLQLVLAAADGRPMAERTTPPVDGLYPTSRWSPGELIRDLVPLSLPAAAPPGRYWLRLTVIDSQGRILGAWEDREGAIAVRRR